MAQSQQDQAGAKKRRRETVNVDVKLVEIYEDLANEQDDIRLKAAQALVSQFTPDKNPTDEQIRKALQRLFRGLCSSRKAARIGFSIALTEVLSQLFAVSKESSDLKVSAVLDIWESQSSALGSESGQEQRDHYFGRLFGAEAVIKSSILFQTNVPLSDWTRVLDLVFDLAKKKPWIREECGWVVYRCVYDFSAKKADVKFVEAALERLSSNDLARTPEGVSIWLAARDMFPNAKFPSKVWKYDDPLDSRDKATLAKIMKESSTAEPEEESKGNATKPSGVWNSKLHFAWDAVLAGISDNTRDEGSGSRNKSSKSSRLNFVDFWTELVDNGLFASASSEERKYWGFLLFIKVLNGDSSQQASLVFTKNLVRCLMNQLAVDDRYLHRMAVKAAKSVQTRVSKEPSFAAAAVNGLMGPTGSVNFDQITKSKTVEKIVVEANADALSEIVTLFEKFIQNPGTTDDKAAASSRQFLAGLLVSIVRARASGSNNSKEDIESILERILLVFVRFAYFKDQVAVQPVLVEATQELFRNRVISCLNSLIASQKYAATIPYTVVRKIRDAAKSEEFGKCIINMDDTVRNSVKNAFKTLKKLSSKAKKEGTPSSAAFKLLYSMTVLQVYNGDADAVSMLDELEFCYIKFLGDEGEGTKSKSKSKSKEESSPEASDALVEILLSFASRPSQLFRRMSEQVFGAFADQITADGLDSLISVLETKENLAGQQEMFEQQDEGGEDEDMMDVDGEDSDVEVVEPEGSEDGEEDEEGGTSDDSGSDNENEKQNDDEVAIFEAKLAEALGTHRADQDLNEQSSEDSDADMNDDEMEGLDNQLMKVFQARRQALSQKKDKKDAKENIVNFKNRVLDLLEIYVKKCHSKVLALDLLLPLLRLTRRSSVKQISNKANSVLREYTRLCKGSAIPSLESTEAAWELLKEIHKEAAHSGLPAHAAGCSQASLLVVRVLVAHDKKTISDIVDVYAATRKEQLLNKRCHIQPSFFTEWNNWCVNASKQMKD